MAALKYWLWLSTRRGLGGRGILQVLDHFVTPERAYFADPGEYELLPPAMARALGDKSMDGAERILADCDRLGVHIMTLQDAEYPERLRQLEDAPAVLYWKGKLPDFDEEPCVGVVGTRSATEYGRQVAGRLGLELARGGAILVSGTAAGIDTCAIKGALQGGGAVVSVLGGGADVPYPRDNRFLYEDIAAAGLLIGEYPPGTGNDAAHFPVRNRIISGLSLGVVVVEAAEYGSGALITAHLALDQNRDVFAVPGNVDAPMSRGCNRLIQQGAKAVMSAEDILVEYRERYPAKLSPVPPLDREQAGQRLEQVLRPEPAPAREKRAVDNGAGKAYSSDKRSPDGFTDDQLAILHALGRQERLADELVEMTQIPARRVLSALTMLQVSACVEQRPGGRFAALVELEE